jgi:hypothetical protein
MPPCEDLAGTAELIELLEYGHDRTHNRLVAALNPLPEFVDVIDRWRDRIQITSCCLAPARAHHALDGCWEKELRQQHPHWKHHPAREMMGVLPSRKTLSE